MAIGGGLSRQIYRKDTNGQWLLTELGKQYIDAPTTKRDLLLIQSILKHPVFYYSLKSYLSHESIRVEDIKNILKKYTDLSESTISRRTGTIKQWIIWLVTNFDVE